MKGVTVEKRVRGSGLCVEVSHVRALNDIASKILVSKNAAKSLEGYDRSVRGCNQRKCPHLPTKLLRRAYIFSGEGCSIVVLPWP